MAQKSFNSLAILNIHKGRSDQLHLIDVANEVVGQNDNLKRQFGKFSALDENILKMMSYIFRWLLMFITLIRVVNFVFYKKTCLSFLC